MHLIDQGVSWFLRVVNAP